MNKIKTVAPLLLLFLSLAGCHSGEGKAATEPYKIGAIVFLTGDAAEYGVWVKNGLEMAKDEINTAGGVNGHPIQLLYEDDNTNARTAVTCINKLLATVHPPVIIAGLTSQSAMAVAPIAESNKVVLFSPCSSTPDYSNAGDYIFRNWASDNEEGRLMAEYAYRKLGYRTIATLTMNNDYGLGLQKVFTARFQELGGKIVLSDRFTEGTTDFRTLLVKLGNQSFDAIYMPSHANEAGAFLKQMRETNRNLKVLGCVTYESPELIKIAGGAAEGVIFTTPAFNPDTKDSAVQRFTANYQKRYGEKPENFAAHSYDALNIIVLAIRNGGWSSDSIRNALYRIKDYPGVSGLTSFDQNGDVSQPAMVKKISEGQFTSVDITK